MSKKNYKKRGKHTVYVFNDDINTYEHVITQLRDLCGHNYFQSIQCTNIIHSVGKCDVYTGPYNICCEIHDELIESGLTAIILKK
jgi:ATP-dependent Clp protease adapter protein ClpS